MELIVGLILLAAIIGGIAYSQYKTNFYWKMVGYAKWRDLQPQLQNIRDIHERATGAGKKINWIEKNLTKSVKKSFDSSKQLYVEYIDFCNSKRLELPDNKAELDELIDITEDALLNPSEALDKELQRTSQQYDDAYKLVSEAGEGLLNQRQESVQVIDKVEQLINSISRHPKSFETDIQEIVVQKQQFRDTIEYGIE